ncbi:MAG TPA: outer membrane beta-barrel protein [Chitinophagaceae bacterium]|nr:outer membrane beta-barrel protein [Chitinophagaceae bacterium]
MRTFSILLLFILTVLSATAQFTGGRGGRGGAGANATIGHFYGKLVDAKTNKGIDAASVQLFQAKFDTATKKRKDSLVGGMLTKANGQFSLENLPVFGSYTLKLSAIGYASVEQKLAFTLKPPQQDAQGNTDIGQALAGVDKDLGNIKMEADAKLLENVTVTASKPLFQMGVDRKIFNVDKSLIGTGQTAQELMKNIPSVNVDIDGNVTLRNAAPTIFVDGRPTTLTLDQIPSDAIESVEIITNPSAKFDASGGTAGILNIVLKKNRKTGYNGNIRAGIDSRGKINGGGDINIKQGKVNVFASANYNQRKSIAEGTVFSQNLTTPETDVSQNSRTVSNGSFAFGRAGLDYLMDNRNTITLSGVIVRGSFNNEDNLNFDSLSNSSIFTHGNQLTNSKANFRNYGGALGYKHNFAKAGKELTGDLNFNSSTNDNNGLYNIQLYDQNNVSKGLPYLRQTIGDGQNKFFTGQIDYSNPITDKAKIEMGARAAIRNNISKSDNFIYNYATGKYDPNESLSSDYKFTDRVFAAYATYSGKLKTWSYQVGFRAESSDYTGTKFAAKDSTFKTNYPISLFPSLFITKDLGDKQDFQINYSRRINRPNFFQLIPYKDITNPQYPTVGNPGLKPEFTNSFEMSYQKTFPKNYSILASVYLKHTTDLITRYQFKDLISDKNADSATFTSYQNANSATSYGLEVTGRTPLTKWWDMTTNINFYNATINATNITNAGNSTQRLSYFAKWNNNFKLPLNFSIQLSGDYQSKSVLPQSSGNGGGGGGRGGGGGGGMFGGGPQPSAQGYVNQNYGFDFAIKKEFLKSKAASFTLSVNDIFKTRKYSYYSYSTIVIQDYSRIRDQQIFRLNFNYRFGKLDVSLFKRKNMRSGMEGVQDAQQQ